MIEAKAESKGTKKTKAVAEPEFTPEEIFRKFLKDGEYRNTPERFEVLDAVMKWDDHFDADNLFIWLKNNGSKVSRATVYKTLNLLHECGLVSRYRFSQGHAQYEKTIDRPHHDHLICTTCGKIIEFDNSRVIQMQNDICIAYGFKPLYHSFQVFSQCLDGAMDISDCEYAQQLKSALMNPNKKHKHSIK
ncbi:MAG: transcriptional repressor [Ignavibacteriota bacterium]